MSWSHPELIWFLPDFGEAGSACTACAERSARSSPPSSPLTVPERRHEQEPSGAVQCGSVVRAHVGVVHGGVPTARNLVRRIAAGVSTSANLPARWFMRLGLHAPTWVPVFAILAPIQYIEPARS
jgi:hypothetical protein